MSERQARALEDVIGGDLMVTCPECEHENEDAAADCAHCGARLPAERTGSAAEEGPAAGGPDPPSRGAGGEGGRETADGGQLFALLMRPGDTARDVAAMDPEALFRTVAYMRKKKFTAGTVDQGLADEQIAEAIVAYARSAPPDTRARDLKRALSPALSPEMASWGLWVKWLLGHGAAVLITGVPGGEAGATTTGSPGLWWAVPLAACAGAVTAMVPGLLLMLLAAVEENSTPAGLMAILAIGLIGFGFVFGAIQGAALGAMGKYAGRQTGRKDAEAIGAVLGGIAGGIMTIVEAVGIFTSD